MRKFDFTKPLKAKNGNRVEILKVGANTLPPFSIVGIHYHSCAGHGQVEVWTEDGIYLSTGPGSNLDLVPNVEVITLDEVIDNALKNFDKLQCIAGPFNAACVYITPGVSRCVIGWSLGDPVGVVGPLVHLVNDGHVQVGGDERDLKILSELQRGHDDLCQRVLPHTSRETVMRILLNLAKKRLLTEEIRYTIAATYLK